jgi:hypothetical protein
VSDIPPGADTFSRTPGRPAAAGPSAAALQHATARPGQAGRRRRAQRERPPPPGRPPLVARSWRAVTPGQREAPTPTTPPGYARESRAARLPWTAPQWRPYTSPPTPTREGLRRPGVWGQRPHDPQQWAGSPAEPEWQPSATLHQRCVAMQAIAALTASWGERVFELAPHLDTPLGERATELRAARLSRP